MLPSKLLLKENSISSAFFCTPADKKSRQAAEKNDQAESVNLKQ